MSGSGADRLPRGPAPDWDLVDWNHLPKRVRWGVRMLLKRLAYLQGQIVARPWQGFDPREAEVSALNTVLGVMADLAGKNRGFGGRPFEARMRPIDDQHCHPTCEWGKHGDDGAIVRCILFAVPCAADPAGGALRCDGCLAAQEHLYQRLRIAALEEVP